MRARWRWLSVATLAGCAGPRPDITATEPLPDPPVVDTVPLDDAELVWSSEDEVDASGLDEMVTVIGLSGVLDQGGSLTVTNTSSGATGGVVRAGNTFVAQVEAALGEEVSTLVATEETLFRAAIVVDPVNDGAPLDGPLWLAPDAEGLSALDEAAVAGVTADLVVYSETTGEALRVSDPAGVSLAADPGDRLCAFTLDASGVPGPILCEELP